MFPLKMNLDCRINQKIFITRYCTPLLFLDEFYFHSDDHFISKDFDYACYYEGTLEDHLQPATAEDYKVTIKNTIHYLRERNLSTKFFNVHCPIYYEKEKFPVLDQHPPYGYCIKSIYCNVNKIQGVLYPDYKIQVINEQERNFE
jgi:hypothetical protein